MAVASGLLIVLVRILIASSLAFGLVPVPAIYREEFLSISFLSLASSTLIFLSSSSNLFLLRSSANEAPLSPSSACLYLLVSTSSLSFNPSLVLLLLFSSNSLSLPRLSVRLNCLAFSAKVLSLYSLSIAFCSSSRILLRICPKIVPAWLMLLALLFIAELASLKLACTEFQSSPLLIVDS